MDKSSAQNTHAGFGDNMSDVQAGRDLGLNGGWYGLRARREFGALFAGLAFSNTKTALAHNISYDITLKHGTIHGIACSFSLPAVMRTSSMRSSRNKTFCLFTVPLQLALP